MTDRSKPPPGITLSRAINGDGWFANIARPNEPRTDWYDTKQAARAAAWAHHDAIRAAVEAEIVAWLRTKNAWLHTDAKRDDVRALAEAIRRGEHRKGEP